MYYYGIPSAQLRMVQQRQDMLLVSTLTENWTGPAATSHSIDIRDYITVLEAYGKSETYSDSYGNKAAFRLSGLDSLYNITTRKAVVILSGAPAESKDLRISFIFAVKLVPRSWGFASLAQDDSCSCFLLVVRFNSLAV